jgi:putative glutamine amidotransferase
MNDPLVGVTCNVRVPREGEGAYTLTLDHRYTTSVKDAGGFPVLLPICRRQTMVESYLEQLDGVLLVGNDDVDPRLYRQQPRRGTRTVYPPRQRFERWVYEVARAMRLPVFGINYGMRLINVLEAGTLHQDIKRDVRSALDHRDRDNPMHAVKVEPHSRLAYVMGRKKVNVESEHHQAICDLAPGFRPVAAAPDGVIEAIECDDESILAVEWNPERTPKTAATRRLFRWFVDLCCRHRRPGRSYST